MGKLLVPKNLFFAFFAITLISCGQNQNPDSLSDPSKTLTGCETSLNIDSISNAYIPNIVTTHFNKTFDYGALKILLSTNTFETVDFLKNQFDTKVFKTISPKPYADNSCNSFTHLPPLKDTELIAHWNKVNASYGSGPQLQGLYLPLGATSPWNNQMFEKSKKSPLILVSDTTDRWTLVHESMHLLFDKELKSNGINSTKIRMSSQGLEKEIRNWIFQIKNGDLSLAANRALAISLGDSLTRLMPIWHMTMNSFSLEEVVIENILLDQFKNGTFKNSPDKSQNSKDYALASGISAIQRLESFRKDVLDSAVTIFEQNKLDHFSNLATKYVEIIETKKEQTRILLSKYTNETLSP